MAQKTVKTSLSRNLAAKIKGIVPIESLFAGICGSLLGLFLALMLGIELGLLQGAAFLVGFVSCFSAHRLIIGGSYPFANLDARQAVSYRKKSNSEIDINKTVKYKASRVEKGKFFVSGYGMAIIGFRINQSSIINFDSFIQGIFGKLSQGVRLRYLKTSKVEKGNLEADTNFLRSEIIIFIEVTNTSLRRDAIIETFWNLLSPYGEALGLEDIRDFSKEIVAPGKVSQEWEIKDGIFPSALGLIREEAMLHYGDFEKRAAIFSMVQIPEEISLNHQKILDLFSSTLGTICVLFESQGETSALSEMLRSQTERLENYEKHASEKEKIVSSKYRINTRMSTLAIVHGSPEEIKQLEKDLDANYRAIPRSELPSWYREHALLEKALLSVFPGEGIAVPARRLHTVIDSEEASLYLPRPTNAGDNNAIVELKTASGEKFGFRLRKKYPMFVWSGVGDGKSVLLGYIVQNYLLRAREGQKIASFVMETGGSCAFIKDENLTDIAFMLEEIGGEFKPFPVPPLKLFFSFGTKGITQAKLWIKSLANIEDDMVMGLVEESLAELRKSNLYRLNSFYEKLEQKIRAMFKSEDPAHFSRRYLAMLRRFCDFDGALYGKIFDVTDNGYDIAKAKHYYFSQIPAPKHKNDLTDAFYSFAHNTFLSFESSLGGDNFYELLLCVDELHNFFKVGALTHTQVRDFNSQGRKEGKDIIMASQELEDLIDDKTGVNLINSFKQFMFASSADANLVLKALKKMNAQTSSELDDLDELIAEIRTYRNLKKMYMWALIDHENRINLLNFTLPLKTLWRLASESAARELKYNLMRRHKLGFHDVVRHLSEVKMSIPEERTDIDQQKLAHLEAKLEELKNG